MDLLKAIRFFSLERRRYRGIQSHVRFGISLKEEKKNEIENSPFSSSSSSFNNKAWRFISSKLENQYVWLGFGCTPKIRSWPFYFCCCCFPYPHQIEIERRTILQIYSNHLSSSSSSFSSFACEKCIHFPKVKCVGVQYKMEGQRLYLVWVYSSSCTIQ